MLRGDIRPDSDIDVLIDIDPDANFTLVNFVGVKMLLESELKQPVDLVARDGLDPLLKTEIIQQAERVF